MSTTHIDNESVLVTATHVPEDERMDFMPRFFGRHMLAGERAIYRSMDQIAPDYTGGFWEFYALSNGGFYMAPALDCDRLRICCAGNFYDDTMSPDAAGIVATLYGLNAMVWKTRDERLLEMFDRLRHYAGDHTEGPKIFAAID